MNKLKIIVLLNLLLLVVIGAVYASVSSKARTVELSDNSDVMRTDSEKLEVNTYVVTSDFKNKVVYSVTQGKRLKATIDGLKPNYMLVHKGDTLKLNIHSKVNCDFRVDGYNIRARTRPDSVTEVTFNVNHPGIFVYRCAGLFSDRSNIGLLEIIE